MFRMEVSCLGVFPGLKGSCALDTGGKAAGNGSR